MVPPSTNILSSYLLYLLVGMLLLPLPSAIFSGLCLLLPLVILAFPFLFSLFMEAYVDVVQVLDSEGPVDQDNRTIPLS